MLIPAGSSSSSLFLKSGRAQRAAGSRRSLGPVGAHGFDHSSFHALKRVATDLRPVRDVYRNGSEASDNPERGPGR